MKLQAIFLIALTTLTSFALADEKDVEFEKAKQFFSKESAKMDKWLGNWNNEWKDIFTEGPAYTGDGTTYGDPLTGGYIYIFTYKNICFKIIINIILLIIITIFYFVNIVIYYFL